MKAPINGAAPAGPLAALRDAALLLSLASIILGGFLLMMFSTAQQLGLPPADMA